MPREITVDKQVYALAAFWLSGDFQDDQQAHTKRVQSLATDIQRAIEDWHEDELREAEQTEAQDAERRSLKGFDPDEIAEKF